MTIYVVNHIEYIPFEEDAILIRRFISTKEKAIEIAEKLVDGLNKQGFDFNREEDTVAEIAWYSSRTMHAVDVCEIEVEE